MFNAPTSRRRSALQLEAAREQQRWVWEALGGSGGSADAAPLTSGGEPPSADGDTVSPLSPAPLRQVEASLGPLGLRFRMCQDTGHAFVDDILPTSPLIESVAIGDLLVAVDEVVTRQLGTSDKVPLTSLETRAC